MNDEQIWRRSAIVLGVFVVFLAILLVNKSCPPQNFTEEICADRKYPPHWCDKRKLSEDEKKFGCALYDWKGNFNSECP